MHAKAAHPRLTEQPVREESARLDLGTICHSLLLEGDVAKIHIIQATRWEGRGKERHDTHEPVTDYKTDAAREERDTARANGQCPLLPHEIPTVTAMIQACRRQLDAHEYGRELFTDAGISEQTIVWREDNGVWCRGRLDWLHKTRPLIADYKTGARSARPSSVSRVAASLGWPMQASFYRRGYRAVFGQDLEPDFLFVAQENYSPFALSVLELGPADLALADAQVDNAVRIFGECLKSRQWPGYSRRVERITSPPWIEAAFMEEQLEER